MLARTATALAAVVLVAAVPAPSRAAEAVAKFYAGRNVSLYIGSTPGGGYDSYARLIARHLGDHIPGKPTIVPANMPGAGSNKLAYYIFAVAPKDGTAIGAIFPGAVIDPLIGDKKVEHDPTKLVYVGSANSEADLCFVRSDSPTKSFKDAMTRETRLAASAEGGSTRDFPAVLDNVLGTKFRLAVGYPGSREIMHAVEQGEVEGACGLGVSSLATAHPDWLPSGQMVPIAQESIKGHPMLNAKHVPLTLDFAKNDEQRQMLELLYSQLVFGRPYVVPPGTPPERVAALRKGFMETMQDPALKEDAKRVRLELEPTSGEDVQALVTKVYATPPAIVAKLKQAMIYQP
ncbi:MAG TPA: tripartite tricarboxylate transporter substrate-binding protein [Stellaceae bacterium]|nr:tripartite tricarboxylate transporter substrate-binding protein [Stellaceae bacterium]